MTLAKHGGVDPRNKLNELSKRQWTKFGKSWFTHQSPPRDKKVIKHPATFSYTLAKEFILFFTKGNQKVLDPMVGTGSTLVACDETGRNGMGIELNPNYADIARSKTKQLVLTGDARVILDVDIGMFDYCITSPPYWDMLREKGDKTQKDRRDNPSLDVHYSESDKDLGNIRSYDDFLTELVTIYEKVREHIKPRGYMTVIVKNVKKKGKIYPLAWELAIKLDRETGWTLKDEKLWCLDNIKLMIYGYGTSWVSNIHHEYCLQFRNER